MMRWRSLNAKTMPTALCGCFPYGWGNSVCASMPRRPTCWPLANSRRGRPSETGTRLPTLDYLGFTHYWGRSRSGKARLKRKTSKKRLASRPGGINHGSVRSATHVNSPTSGRRCAGKMRGHFNYFGVTDNSPALYRFERAVRRLCSSGSIAAARRRSFTWERFRRYEARYPLPRPGRLVSLIPRW